MQFEALRVSSTGLPNDWLPLCGKYTNAGTADQDEGMPLYDGVQNTWVEEEIDMTEFLGDSIQLRFQLVSDNFVTGDGFYFDDFKLYINGSMDSVINNVSDVNIKSIMLPLYQIQHKMLFVLTSINHGRDRSISLMRLVKR